MPRLPSRRIPSQARSHATLQVIREAALKILEQDGPKRLTTNRIAEVAGVSIGSVYQYYADKYAIADDLCKQLLLEDLEDVDRITDESTVLASQSLEETLRFVIRESVARHRKLYQRLKSYYLELHWRFDFEHYVVDAFPQYHLGSEWLPWAVLEPHAHEIRIQDHEYSAKILMNMIEGTIHLTLSRNPEMILEDRFIDELVGVALCYLKRSAFDKAD